MNSVFIFIGKIQAHFRCSNVFVTRCTAVITTDKGFFDMFVVNWDAVTTNGTNRIVIVPKASGTLNHRSRGHMPALTMMTWFRRLFFDDSFLIRLIVTFPIIAFRLTFRSIATVTLIITFAFAVRVLSIGLFFLWQIAQNLLDFY